LLPQLLSCHSYRRLVYGLLRFLNFLCSHVWCIPLSMAAWHFHGRSMRHANFLVTFRKTQQMFVH
jgi:hypothetical protein